MERQASRSVKITWTGGGRDRTTSSATKKANFGKPDFHDLGYRPSNVDVHRCSSASCTVCRGTVNFNHRLPRISSTDLIPEAYRDHHDYHDDDDDVDDNDDDDRDDRNVQRGGGEHRKRGEGGHRGQHRGNSSSNDKKNGKYSSRSRSALPAVLDVTTRDVVPAKGVVSPHVKFVRVSNSRNMRDWHSYSDERLRVLSKTSSLAHPQRPKYEEERNRRWVFL
jgi:hypothetical protein